MPKKALYVLFVVGIAVGAVSCSSHYVLDPPAVDLGPLGPLGLITFSVVNAKGDLDEIATQSFLQHVTAAQRVPVLEIGKLDAVFTKTGAKALDPAAAKAIGQSYEVKSFFHGDVRISKVKPQVDLNAMLGGSLAVRASYDIAVTVRLVSTETGATLWTRSAAQNGTVGMLTLGADQVPYFGMTDKDQATIDLIRNLMHQLTWDFRPTERRI
jgi:hypothetical protein